MLKGIAQPIGSNSLIVTFQNEATIYPKRIWHFGIIPGGNTVKMVKIKGDWFFTGEIHID